MNNSTPDVKMSIPNVLANRQLVAESIFSFKELTAIPESVRTDSAITIGDLQSIILMRLGEFYLVGLLDPTLNGNYRVKIYL